MTYPRRNQNYIILMQNIVFVAPTIFLTARKNNAQFVFVCVPVITIIHDVVSKNTKMDIIFG